MTTLTARAFQFAAEAHGLQVRKYTGEPYISHAVAVAEKVAAVSGSEEAIAAAYLHDVLEDTAVTEGMLRAEFGDAVADMVVALTDLPVGATEDGKRLNRAARKIRDRERLARAPAEVQTIKLADVIDNTRTIVHYDPEFAALYLVEKEALVAALELGHPALRQQARSQAARLSVARAP